MASLFSDEGFFVRIFDEADTPPTGAPSRLKSRIYSALVRRQQETGPLLSLPATETAGKHLCVFENLVRIAPLGEQQKCFNVCSICHARVLGEHVEDAPIFWPNCPYVAFQKH